MLVRLSTSQIVPALGVGASDLEPTWGGGLMPPPIDQSGSANCQSFSSTGRWRGDPATTVTTSRDSSNELRLCGIITHGLHQRCQCKILELVTPKNILTSCVDKKKSRSTRTRVCCGHCRLLKKVPIMVTTLAAQRLSHHQHQNLREQTTESPAKSTSSPEDSDVMITAAVVNLKGVSFKI